MLRAILSAAFVFMSMPVSIPADRILKIAGVMSFTPDIIRLHVSCMPHPESSPPMTAPRISAYTGAIFLIIKRMAIINPIDAASELFIIYAIQL